MNISGVEWLFYLPCNLVARPVDLDFLCRELHFEAAAVLLDNYLMVETSIYKSRDGDPNVFLEILGSLLEHLFQRCDIMEPMLREIPFKVRRQLVNSLNLGDRWKRIIEELEVRQFQFSLNVDMVKYGMNPGEWVLQELNNRNCSLDVFSELLRELDLLEELALIIPPEALAITDVPGDELALVFVGKGEELKLSCKATGVPRPSYLWHHNNIELDGQSTPHLSIKPFTEKDEGQYTCVVRQIIRGHVSEQSRSVDVEMLPIRPVITTNLRRFCPVIRGQSAKLRVEAEGHPSPCYEWLRTECGRAELEPNILLPESSNELEVKYVTDAEEGVYCCRVSNKAGEILSNCCFLSVFQNPPKYMASAKVALLVANERYHELRDLAAPANDVAILAEILHRLGFHVIALQDLTRSEMYNAFQWFRKILPKNAYAFFYFAGHGCSVNMLKVMMPVDCPADSTDFKNYLCDQHLMKIISQGPELQLLVMLFDHCLDERVLSTEGTVFTHDLGKCNVVIGTATRNYQSAFESMTFSEGLFMNNLKLHLEEPKPIEDILYANKKGFKDKEQKPTTISDATREHSLADPVEKNEEIEQNIQPEVEFHSFDQEISFSKTNEKFSIHVCKHKDCFMNSIDLKFPECFKYNFSVQIDSEELKMTITDRIVTIHNIEKLKELLRVTVILNSGCDSQEMSTGPDNSVTFKLACKQLCPQLFNALNGVCDSA